MNSLFRIAHLSDPHLTSNPRGKRFEPKWNAQLTGMNGAFRHVLSSEVVQSSNLILVTGDVTDRGDLNGWTQFVQIVADAGLQSKVLAIVGNHDVCGLSARLGWSNRLSKADLERARNGLRLAGQPHKYPWAKIVEPRLVIFGLDSNNSGNLSPLDNAVGRIGGRQLQRFAELLAKHKDIPVKIVAIHHSPNIPEAATAIVAHEDAASQNLYEIVRRYYDNLPEPRPQVSTQNVKEMIFADTDSGYKVSSARTLGTGRSATVQRLHGSEVAFWLHADDHAAGLLQAVPDADGTEVIFESTANGPRGFFFERWQEIEGGSDPDWIAVFTPWTLSPEYSYTPREGEDAELTADEREYGSAFGLNAGQLLWRRRKLRELRDPLLFAQEYPITAAEAFVLSGTESFIQPAAVLGARKADSVAEGGPLIIGLDPAGTGGDRIAMAFRRGRICEKIETRTGIDTMGIVGWLVSVVRECRPDAAFIDATGIGQGVYDRAKEMIGGDIIVGVHNAGKPLKPPQMDAQGRPVGGPYNRRAECWMELRDWLTDEGGCSIPDRDDLQADLTGLRYSYDSSGRLKLERKEDMKKRGLRSPDLADALALTFAEPRTGSSFHRDLTEHYNRYGHCYV